MIIPYKIYMHDYFTFGNILATREVFHPSGTEHNSAKISTRSTLFCIHEDEEEYNYKRKESGNDSVAPSLMTEKVNILSIIVLFCFPNMM